MGYSSPDESLAILKRFKSGNPLETITGVVAAEDIVAAQESYSQVTADDDVLRYLIRLVDKTREHSEVSIGVSPRGGQALLKAAQVHAILQGRDFVTPDDIKANAKTVLAHRILLKNALRARSGSAEAVIDGILQEVPVPAEEQLFSR